MQNLNMIKYFIIIFLTLLFSRLIPHPPNFTNLISLSFYIPIILGIRYIPILILSFVITDLIIEYHTLTHWTWGVVFFISFFSKFFKKNILSRFIGLFIFSLIFFIITNFGFWVSGFYQLTLDGLYLCYINAIPFYKNTLYSTIFYSLIIEIAIRLYNNSKIIKRIYH